MDDRPDELAERFDPAGDPDEPPAGPGHRGGPEPVTADARVGDGVEHLQTAVREVIAAARVFLDVAEDVVGDGAATVSVADLLGSLAQIVTRAAGPAATGGPSTHEDQPDDGEPRVQHINVT
jgi:hypothetical protein